jgi:hypothetical protein
VVIFNSNNKMSRNYGIPKPIKANFHQNICLEKVNFAILIDEASELENFVNSGLDVNIRIETDPLISL